MKDDRTSQLRQQIGLGAPAAIEDERAESGLTVLSYRSDCKPERHIWIDTDLAGKLVIDLEDWSDETTWDNSVADLEVPDYRVPVIVQAWLTGATVQECSRAGLFATEECPVCHIPVPPSTPVGHWDGDRTTAGFLYAVICNGCGSRIIGTGKPGGEPPEVIIWTKDR